jgi:hypothetical protein
MPEVAAAVLTTQILEVQVAQVVAAMATVAPWVVVLPVPLILAVAVAVAVAALLMVSTAAPAS